MCHRDVSKAIVSVVCAPPYLGEIRLVNWLQGVLSVLTGDRIIRYILRLVGQVVRLYNGFGGLNSHHAGIHIPLTTEFARAARSCF